MQTESCDSVKSLTIMQRYLAFSSGRNVAVGDDLHGQATTDSVAQPPTIADETNKTNFNKQY